MLNSEERSDQKQTDVLQQGTNSLQASRRTHTGLTSQHQPVPDSILAFAPWHEQ